MVSGSGMKGLTSLVQILVLHLKLDVNAEAL